MEKVQNNLGYTEIRAPFDGWIGKLNFDVGAVVSPASGPITEILVTDPMYVGFQVNEADFVAYRRAGQAAAETRAGNLSLSLTLPDGERYDQGAFWTLLTSAQTPPPAP